MSRSYKKYPVVVQEKDDMRQYNRKLRHDKMAEIPNGAFFKRNRGHCYYHYRWSERDAREFYRRWKNLYCYFRHAHVDSFETEEDYVNWYKKEVVYK